LSERTVNDTGVRRHEQAALLEKPEHRARERRVFDLVANRVSPERARRRSPLPPGLAPVRSPPQMAATKSCSRHVREEPLEANCAQRLSKVISVPTIERWPSPSCVEAPRLHTRRNRFHELRPGQRAHQPQLGRPSPPRDQLRGVDDFGQMMRRKRERLGAPVHEQVRKEAAVHLHAALGEPLDHLHRERRVSRYRPAPSERPPAGTAVAAATPRARARAPPLRRHAFEYLVPSAE
jgi:hypothetical protein